MNRTQAVLLAIAILTLPLITLFIPDSDPPQITTLEGVELSDMSGHSFRFSLQFAEKPTLLAFWSVTCSTCIEEIPFLSRLQSNHSDKLDVIGIHPPGFPQMQIQRFLARYPDKIPYMLAIDNNRTLIDAYNVTILPRTILIDRQGRVLYDHLGFDPDSEKEIKNEILSKL